MNNEKITRLHQQQQTVEDRKKVEKKNLPDELKQQLSKSFIENRNSALAESILVLIEKEELDIDSMILKHWENTGEVLKRASVHGVLRNLVKEQKVVKPSRDKFRKTLRING